MSTKLVREALSRFPKLRDNDMRLAIYVWSRQGLHLTKEQRSTLLGCSSMDFISRRRREMRDKFPESQKAWDRRHKHYKEEKERYSGGGLTA